MLPAGGNPVYYVEDLLGTSRVLTTSTGVVCYDADFYPYGGERSYTNTCPQNYKFEGKERDTETGNDDFGARYYSNRFGRWLSADWSSVPVPVPYANLTNPQTLNLYSMVVDDPESFADLDGHIQQQSQGGAEGQCGGGTGNTGGDTCARQPADQSATQAQNQQQAEQAKKQAQNQGVCGSNASCVGAGQHIENKDDHLSATGNAAFVKAEAETNGVGGRISAGVIDATLNTTSLAPGQKPGQGVSSTGQVGIQGATGNAEASAKVGANGAQLKVGAEAVLFKMGGTLNLHLGSVTIQVSASYQFGVAAKAGGSATIGPSGFPTSVGGSVSAALGPVGASGGFRIGSTNALSAQQ